MTKKDLKSSSSKILGEQAGGRDGTHQFISLLCLNAICFSLPLIKVNINWLNSFELNQRSLN